MANAPQTITVDFSDVKESSGINPKHQPEADYGMRIIKTELTKTKAGDPMALILFQDVNMRSAVYPYYCTFATNMLWKIRNTFIAAGVPVPKGKGKIDLSKLVNKEVGVTLEDDEYDGKMKSVISAVFHKDELEPTDAEDDDELDGEDEEVEEDDEEETVIDAAPPAKKKRAPEPEPEEDDEDEEEEAPKVSARTAKRRAEKAAAEAAAAEAEEEDDEEEDEEPAPVVKKKRKPAPVVEDDEDDDLDLDDI